MTTQINLIFYCEQCHKIYTIPSFAKPENTGEDVLNNYLMNPKYRERVHLCSDTEYGIARLIGTKLEGGES